ncbi:NADP-dependent oxidoreductase [Amycolatopsis sp.]|uniref:NADP-dependent oxidoreductase n=1 Tax=Amycolatopsis sp. TaxID=37632 RepID=UPI002DFF55FA|nr:NADP-dependent oxidoreductase [Amycolatopsis sp.]
MPRAVRFDEYGDIDVLRVVEVDRPAPGRGQALVRVKAAGINPGEAYIRQGLAADKWPATFPSGQGSDLAGIIEELGVDAGEFELGDEVFGFTHKRASQAEYVLVDIEDLVLMPTDVSWDEAGSLFVAGTTAYAAVRAVSLSEGDVVVVSGAAGGVGSLAAQLAKNAGATVIGLAGQANHAWLVEHGVVPVSYGEGALDRIQVASDGRIDAFIDTFGGGYVELALHLGVHADRINTVIDFDAATKYGVKAEANADAASAEVLSELAALIAKGVLEVPIARTYPLDDVRDAYRELEKRHTRGKIVLKP